MLLASFSSVELLELLHLQFFLQLVSKLILFLLFSVTCPEMELSQKILLLLSSREVQCRSWFYFVQG